MFRISGAAAVAAGLAGVWALGAAGAAQSAVTVFGDDNAQFCYQAAKNGFNRSSDIENCTQAIQFGSLATPDLAGTYVNRGAVYLALHNWAAAQSDFHQALMLEPKMGEALVNLGAAEIGLHNDKAGVDDITQGLALGSQEPEKGYYNRAIGYEALGDDKDAYYDYMKAAELNPKWQSPRQELVRFTVHTR
jgi:tetratricopeptide (TPR) repeat protein